MTVGAGACNLALAGCPFFRAILKKCRRNLAQPGLTLGTVSGKVKDELERMFDSGERRRSMKQINRGWGLKTGAQHKKYRAKPGKCRPQGGSPTREPSAAGRGWKRRNSRQSAVFAEGGNGTVVGISELVEEDGFEPSKAKPADLQSVPFGHLGTPPYEIKRKRWSWWTDSNPRPADYKSAALPAELHQHGKASTFTTEFIIAVGGNFVNSFFQE